MQTDLYFVDFVEKKLLAKKTVNEQSCELKEQLDQECLDKFSFFSIVVECGTVYIEIDPRASNVDVPDFVRAKGVASLSFSKKVSSSDLQFDEFLVSQTLSFKGVFTKVKIPWESVLTIASVERGVRKAWEKDFPELEKFKQQFESISPKGPSDPSGAA